MSDLIIKKANLADIIAINEITNYAIVNSAFNLNTQTKTIRETSLWFDEHKSLNYPIIVAIIDGHVAGWASLSKFRQFSGYDPTAEVSVYVRSKYHRQGIGTALVEALCHEAVERGLHCLVSVITAKNTPSLLLHQKIGFQKIGIFKEAAFKNGEYIDVVFVSKLLKDNNDQKGVVYGKQKTY